MVELVKGLHALVGHRAQHQDKEAGILLYKLLGGEAVLRPMGLFWDL